MTLLQAYVSYRFAHWCLQLGSLARMVVRRTSVPGGNGTECIVKSAIWCQNRGSFGMPFPGFIVSRGSQPKCLWDSAGCAPMRGFEQ